MSGKPGIDLNTLSPSASAYGDYGIHDPVNAWPDASRDVVVNVNYLGSNLMQTGFDAATPAVRWTRAQQNDVWGDWSRVATTSEAGGSGIAEAPMDGKIYARKNGVWVPVVHLWQTEYNFTLSITEPPSTGQIRLNNLNQTAATKMWVFGIDAIGDDKLNYLTHIATGGLNIQDKDDSTKSETYNVTGSGVVKTNYVEFPLVWVRGKAPLVAQRVTLTAPITIPETV